MQLNDSVLNSLISNVHSVCYVEIKQKQPSSLLFDFIIFFLNLHVSKYWKNMYINFDIFFQGQHVEFISIR